jgi:hypothetical protein
MTDRQLSDREVKALQIAAKSKLTQKGNVWLVPSQAGHGEYEVRPDPTPRCTCPDFEFRNAKCKHVLAVEYTLMRETTADGQTVVTETVKVTRKTYSQDWKAYNAAQTHEKSELQAYLFVSDSMWNKVVPKRLTNKVVCLACFDRFAARRKVDYRRNVRVLYFAGRQASFKFRVVWSAKALPLP